MSPRSCLTLASLLLLAGIARGQGSDAALKDRVNQLVERLADAKAEAADAAEKALVNLGARALPLLPDASKLKDAKHKARLEKVREAIADAMEGANLGPSLITLKGEGLRLSEVIKQLQVQSGNLITDLREANGGEATNPSIDVDFDKKPFFEALDIVAKKADVALNFFSGDGSIALTPGAGEDADKPNQIGEDGPKLKERVVYSGPFRILIKNYALSTDFASGSSNANAQFDIAWEPRLRPMLLALKAENIKIVDDRGEEIAPTISDESSNVVLRPENPVAEMNLNMSAPDREAGAKRLKSLKVKAEVTLPAGVKSFKFPSLVKPGTIKQGDITVQLESAEVEEQVWKVRVQLEYPGQGPAFESYRQGLFNNLIWLQKSDGSRFEHNGGFSNIGSDGGKLGFEYLFVDAPGKLSDYGLVYQTPSKVLTIPLEFEFKDVPLP